MCTCADPADVQLSITVLQPLFHGQFFLDEIICHRNFGNEFAFTHNRLVILLRSLTFTMKLRHRIEFTRIFFCDKKYFFFPTKNEITTLPVNMWIISIQENMSVKCVPPYTPLLYILKLGFAGVTYTYFFSNF